MKAGEARRSGHVCPWWIGALLCCPLRRLVESPQRLLGPYVRPGMAVLEPGCGMGYFTLPLARMVGPGGKLVCVDLQQRMVSGLLRRARRAGLAERIEATVCSPESLGLAPWRDRIDLAVAIHVVHEVGDQRRFLEEIRDALRPGGELVLLEPRGHVSVRQLDATLARAHEAGFEEGVRAGERPGFGALLRKPEERP